MTGRKYVSHSHIVLKHFRVELLSVAVRQGRSTSKVLQSSIQSAGSRAKQLCLETDNGFSFTATLNGASVLARGIEL